MCSNAKAVGRDVQSGSELVLPCANTHSTIQVARVVSVRCEAMTPDEVMLDEAMAEGIGVTVKR
jgi:hypothetical protein